MERPLANVGTVSGANGYTAAPLAQQHAQQNAQQNAKSSTRRVVMMMMLDDEKKGHERTRRKRPSFGQVCLDGSFAFVHSPKTNLIDTQCDARRVASQELHL